MPTIKLLSDVHLERFDVYPGIDRFIPSSKEIDIICLCGDIGSPKDESYARLIADCTERCNKYVFVIMGNHEAYGLTITDTATRISQVCDDINKSINKEKAVFLNNSSFDVDGLRFMGSTLWSHIKPEEAWNIRTCLSDYKYIKGWTLSDAMDTYHANVAWLRASLAGAMEDGIRVVVLTHHAPLSDVGSPKHNHSRIRSAFCSDLSQLILEHTNIISHWFYGHNHYSQSTTIGSTVVVSNQVGYQDNDDAYGYNSELIITL